MICMGSERQITRLGSSFISQAVEFDGTPDRLSPMRGEAHGEINSCLVLDKTVLLDEIAGEARESVAVTMTVKNVAHNRPQSSASVCGWTADSIFYAHQGDPEEKDTELIEIDKVAGLNRDRKHSHCSFELMVAHQGQLHQFLNLTRT